MSTRQEGLTDKVQPLNSERSVLSALEGKYLGSVAIN